MTSIATQTRIEEPAMKATAALHIACWGSSGSGKSSVAVNLACELADLGQRVLLVDADSHRPSLAAMLGITNPGPGITALLRLIRAGRFDLEELKRLGHQIELGSKSLWLVTGMNSPARWPELDAASLSALATGASEYFDVLVWDLASDLELGVVGGDFGGERNIATNCILGFASHSLGLFAADPVGINRFLFDIRSVGRDIIPVANRVRSTVLGRNPERQLRDALFQLSRIKLEHEIVEEAGFDEMLKNVRPLMLQANRSKARETIRQIAQQILDSPND